MSFQFKVLKAEHGDSMLIKGILFEGRYRNILIDGGPSQTFKRKKKKGQLLKELELIKSENQKIDLLILTHVDDDHIAGLLKGFKNDGILSELTERVWFNSGSIIDAEFNNAVDPSHLVEFNYSSIPDDCFYTSIKQGISFEDVISRKKIWQEGLILAGDNCQLFGASFRVLSPNMEKLKKLLVKWEKEQSQALTGSAQGDYHIPLKQLIDEEKNFQEDSTIHNGSSIAFIFEYENIKLLLLGDAHNDIIVEEIKKMGYSKEKPLHIDFVKLSHHGSKYNTSPELLKLIDCHSYIVSSNTLRFNLPDKTTIARIAKYKPNSTIYFNYPDVIDEKIFSKADLEYVKLFGVRLQSCDEAFDLS